MRPITQAWNLLVPLLLVPGAFGTSAQVACPQGAEVFPVQSQAGAYFGSEVKVSGDRIVVGAPFYDGTSPDSGAGYLFERDPAGPNAWIQVRKLTGNYQQLAKAGAGVDVDGDIVAVNITNLGYGLGSIDAHEEDLGGPGFWGSTALFTVISPSDGLGIEISLEGDTLLSSGASFASVFERSGPGVWTETRVLVGSTTAIGDKFSSDVALSGDTALVGSAGEDCNFGEGSAFIFERNAGGPNNWGEVKILCGSDSSFDDRFGDSVALDGDTAVIGAFLEDSQALDAGAVYVFERNLGGPGNWGEVKKLTAPDGADSDYFSWGEGLALQGDLILVGSTQHDAGGPNAGAVYAYERNLGGPDNWGFAGRVDGFRPGQEFGNAIDIDGNRTVVGADRDDTFGPEAGVVYVFEGDFWIPGGFTTYCTAGTSAAGCQALLSATGTPSASLSTGFLVQADQVEGNRDGVFFFGTSGQQANPWGNGTSYQCVVPPVKRAGLLSGTGTVGLCNGAFSQDLNAHWTAKPNHNPGPGAQVQIQLWYRDPANTSNQTTSLSEAGQFSVCP